MNGMKPNSCNNKPRSNGYYVIVRKYNDGNSGIYYTELEYIPDVMSKECNYDKRSNDARCAGCVK